MPGMAEIGGTHEMIYFPTTWLVSDSVRGQSVGSLLFRESLGLNKALICTGMNNNSESALLYMGYEPMKSIYYWQVYFVKCNKRFNRTLDKFNNRIRKSGTNRHFLQPNQYVEGSKEFTKEEMKIAIETGPFDYRDAAQMGYPLLIDKGKQLKAKGINFIDLTLLFRSENRTVYNDKCCHFNQLGYDQIGDRIVDVILE